MENEALPGIGIVTGAVVFDVDDAALVDCAPLAEGVGRRRRVVVRVLRSAV